MEIMALFRIAAIFLGLVFGFFSYRIFILTKGSSNGWTYMSIAGIVLSFWAIIQVAFIENFLIVNLTSFVGFTAIGVLLPLGFITLNRNFGIQLCSFFSGKSLAGFYAGGWAILLILNLLVLKPAFPLAELAGIAHFLLRVMALYTIYPLFKMWRQRGRWFWLLNVIFVTLIGVSIIMGAYFAGGCEKMDEPIEMCNSLSTHYSEILPMPYPEGVVSVTSFYHGLLLPGLVAGAIGFVGIWRQLG